MQWPGPTLTLIALLLGCNDALTQPRERHPEATAPDSSEPAAHGFTYYVRPTGDDRAAGTELEQSWRSVARVDQQAFNPGDRVLFEGGHDYAGSLVFDAGDRGSSDAPIQIGSFGGERATIVAEDGDGLTLTDTAGFVIQDLILRGGWDADSQAGNAGEGLRATNHLGRGQRLSGLRVENVEVSGFKFAGIALHAAPPDGEKLSGFEAVVVTDCSVHDNGDFGVVSDGPFDPRATEYSHRSLSLRRLRVFDNRGLKDKGSHTGSGIVLSDVEDASIERSVAFNNGEFNDHPGGGGFGIWSWDSSRVTIRNNESYGNKTSSSDGGGFDLDGGMTNSILEYNYSHDNQGAGYGAFQFQSARPYSQNVVRYNISQNDGAALSIWDGNGDMGALDAYQNVGYGSQPSLVTYSALRDVRLFNNIFFGSGDALADVYDDSGMTLLGNDYWSGLAPFVIRWNSGSAQPRQFSDFELFRGATGQETLGSISAGKHVDPALVGEGMGPTLGDADQLSTLREYRLRADSPLIDQGVDLTAYDIDNGGFDFFGAAAPAGAGFDIGVNEIR